VLFEIFSIVVPVFVLVIVGYAFAKIGLVTDSVIDGLMRFGVLIAIPCLLFRTIYSLDLNTAFEWRSLVAYYAGAVGCFVIAFVIFQFGFKKRPGESIGIAFSVLFSNLVMLGVPISERAWGLEFMTPNFLV
jgi:predicted permease